jgi:uncharacterized protein
MPLKTPPRGISTTSEDATPVNPFNYGRELGPHELADRAQEVQEATRAMLEGGKLFLIGPRRYGKTSIIRAAELKAIEAGAIVLRYDVSAFPGIDVLTARIATDAAAAFSAGADRVLQVVKNLFGALRPTVSVDVNSGAPTITFEGGSGGRRDPVPLLTDVLNGIEAAATKRKRRVAVVFDEFQEIVEMGGGTEGGEKIEQQMRAAVQRHKQVGYVFAGSKTQLLIEMTTTHGRAFFNLGDKRFIGPVPRPDFSALLENGFASGSIPVAEGALDTMLDLAEDVPYTVQLLARACWDTCRATTPVGTRPVSLTVALVTQVHERIVREYDASFSIVWDSITLSQRTALRALVQTGGVGLASVDVSRRYNISVSTLRTALISLKQQGILRDDRALGVSRTRFEDPLFGAWVRLVINP